MKIQKPAAPVGALIVALVISFTGFSVSAKECVKGKACGNSCIATDAICHKDAAPTKVCKKGKACGKSCIAKDDVCHK